MIQQLKLMLGKTSLQQSLLQRTILLPEQALPWPSMPVVDKSFYLERQFNGFSTIFNDTWTLSFDSTTQAYTWANVTPTNNPSARAFSSMAFDASSGQIILLEEIIIAVV